MSNQNILDSEEYKKTRRITHTAPVKDHESKLKEIVVAYRKCAELLVSEEYYQKYRGEDARISTFYNTVFFWQEKLPKLEEEYCKNNPQFFKSEEFEFENNSMEKNILEDIEYIKLRKAADASENSNRPDKWRCTSIAYRNCIEKFLSSNETYKLYNNKTQKELKNKLEEIEVDYSRKYFQKLTQKQIAESKFANKETIMGMDMSEKPTIFEQFKSDTDKAAYRVAGTQMTAAVKKGLLLCLAESGAMDNDKITVIAELLETQGGDAFTSYLLGQALGHMPVVGNDPRAIRLAEEFRIAGIATTGNLIMTAAMKYFLPAIQSAMASLPPLVSDAKNEMVSISKADWDRLEKLQSQKTRIQTPENEASDEELYDDVKPITSKNRANG